MNMHGAAMRERPWIEKRVEFAGRWEASSGWPRVWQQLNDLAWRIRFRSEREFGLCLGVDEGGRVWFEILCRRPDTFTGEFGTGRGGRRYVRSDVGMDELNRAVFGAYVGYGEHECRESYVVDGVRVFGPHIPLSVLLVAGRQVEVR